MFYFNLGNTVRFFNSSLFGSDVYIMPNPKMLITCSKCGNDFMKETGLLTPCTKCGYTQ